MSYSGEREGKISSKVFAPNALRHIVFLLYLNNGTMNKSRQRLSYLLWM